MDFYVDSAVLCGFIMNYLSFNTAAGVLRINASKKRIVIGAFVLSVLGCLCVFEVRLKILFIPIYIIAVRVIFKAANKYEVVRRIAACLCANLLFSAVFLTVVPPSALLRVLCGNGAFFAVKDTYFYGLLIIVYAAVKFILFLTSSKKRMFRVRLVLGDNVVETMAMIDTGNSLRDRETGAPVIVAERSLFKHVNLQPKTIPCRTVGDDGQSILIYPIDSIFFPEENRKITGAYAALVDRPLSEDGKYRALLHNSLG